MDVDKAVIAIELPEARTFDNLMLQEFVREGQRIAAWHAEALIEGQWQLLTTRRTVGYRCISRFEKVTTDKVRITIDRSWDQPMISNFGLFLTDPAYTKAKQEVTLMTGPEPCQEAPKAKGLHYDVYEGGLQSAELVSAFNTAVWKTGTLEQFSIGPAGRPTDYGIRYQGFIRVPEDGEYTFGLTSADASWMCLGDLVIINNDEPHEVRRMEQRVLLKKGWYPIDVRYTCFRHEGMFEVEMPEGVELA